MPRKQHHGNAYVLLYFSDHLRKTRTGHQASTDKKIVDAVFAGQMDKVKQAGMVLYFVGIDQYRNGFPVLIAFFLKSLKHAHVHFPSWPLVIAETPPAFPLQSSAERWWPVRGVRFRVAKQCPVPPRNLSRQPFPRRDAQPPSPSSLWRRVCRMTKAY